MNTIEQVIDAAVESAARAHHETYERLAPAHGYETRAETRVPWEELPLEHRRLTLDAERAALVVAVRTIGAAFSWVP